MNKMNSLWVTLALLASGPAHAASGGTGAHGGDILFCKARTFLKIFEIEGAKSMLADSYEAGLKGTTLTIEELGENKILELALVSIAESNAELADRLRQHLAQFQWIYVHDLEELNDDDIQDVPKGCEKKQVAIQDMSTGVIRVHNERFGWLTQLDRALLKLHEAFIKESMPKDDRIQNTRLVRERIGQVATSAELKTRIDQTSWSQANPIHQLIYQFFRGRHRKISKDIPFAQLDKLWLDRYDLMNTANRNSKARHEAYELVKFLNAHTAGRKYYTTDYTLYERFGYLIMDPEATAAAVAIAADRIYVPNPEEMPGQ
jgi:hypothetical protein